MQNAHSYPFLILLSPKVVDLTRSCFERKPRIGNSEFDRKLKEKG